MWTLENSLPLFRELQGIARPYGYFLALGGGVINKGYSAHDLDIVAGCYTREADRANPNSFLEDITRPSRSLLVAARAPMIEAHGAHTIAFLFFPYVQRAVEMWFLHHGVLQHGEHRNKFSITRPHTP